MFQLDLTPTPQPGDIVIERAQDSPVVWLLGAHQQPKQIRCRTYEEALQRASGYGQRKSIDVFYTEDGGLTFSLIVRHRDA